MDVVVILFALHALLGLVVFGLVSLMGVTGLLKSVHYFFVLRGAFLDAKHTPRVLKVKQVICGHDCLQAMGDHNNCQLALLLHLDVHDGILDFCLAFRV